MFHCQRPTHGPFEVAVEVGGLEDLEARRLLPGLRSRAGAGGGDVGPASLGATNPNLRPPDHPTIANLNCLRPQASFELCANQNHLENVQVIAVSAAGCRLIKLKPWQLGTAAIKLTFSRLVQPQSGSDLGNHPFIWDFEQIRGVRESALPECFGSLPHQVKCIRYFKVEIHYVLIFWDGGGCSSSNELE